MVFALYEPLHAKCNPRYEAFDHTTPDQYVRRIAGYIKDASTIRARTLYEYGRSPSIEEIGEVQASIAAAKEMLDYGPPIGAAKPKKTPPPPRKSYSPPTSAIEAIEQVAEAHNLSYGEIVGTIRTDEIFQVRALTAALLYARAYATMTAKKDVSFSKIGKLINRDRSTINHAMGVFAGWRERGDHEMVASYFKFLEDWMIEDPAYRPRL